MRVSPYWIELPRSGRLAIMPRPRAGDWLEGEIALWRSQDISTVISLLEASEIEELELEREAKLCLEAGIEVISFEIADRGVPRSTQDTLALARTVIEQLNQGRAVAIHCRAGIGRSSLIAACVLVLAGLAPEDAFARIALARGLTVPDTNEQVAWVNAFAHGLSKKSELRCTS